MTTTPFATTTSASAPATRLARTTAYVAAVAFVVEGAITLVHHTGEDHWDFWSQVLNSAYAVGALALVVALAGLPRWLRTGRIGVAGVVAAQLGCLAMVVESVASGLHDGNMWGPVFFAGLLLALVGQLTLGIAALVAGDRRWAALLPFLGLLVGIVGGEHGGGIVTGLVWAVLGTAAYATDAAGRD